MTPYYADDLVTIYHGKCEDVLPSLAPVDCVIADPPYGETSLGWDAWVEDWPSLMEPVTSSMWCFGSMRMFFDHLDEFGGWRLSQDIVWEKHNGSGFHADRFRRIHEHVTHWYRGAWGDTYHVPPTTDDAVKRTVRTKRRPTHTGHIDATPYVSEDGGPRLQRSVIKVRSEHGRALHPTAKPVGIVRPLIEYACPPGGMVLDPFMGSGTTLRAAKDCGRRAIGVEVDERYCEIAAKRMAQEALDFGGVA